MSALRRLPTKAGTMGGTRGRGANASTSRAEEDRAMASAFGGGGGSGGGVTDAGNSAFLSELNQSWKEIEEDEDGNLLVSGSKARDKRLRERREKLLTNASTAKRIRRGMIRFVQVVIDLSRASLISDMRPSRLKVISEELQRFVRTFFDSNPLSQLSLSCTRNGLAKVITELSGSPQKHIDHLKLLGTQKLGLDCTGDASVQNCLDLSLKQLRDVPPYGHREVLFLMTSLTTCDPGDVFASIDQARANKMHCSVIGLGAEVFVLKSLAEKTGGKYHVATSEAHLQNVLDQYAPPPPALEKETPSSLVQMGFPNFVGDHGTRGDALCFVGPESDLSKGKSFTCPRCKARVKDLPQACHVCGLSLVSSAHLARSYHHLFPVPLFLEVGPVKQEQGAANVPKDCSACGKPLESLTLQCPECKELYCITCDVFIHEQLHNCPGCG